MPGEMSTDFDDLWDYDLWNYNDPPGSEAAFRALIPTVNSDGMAAHLGELLTQVARAQGLQGNFTAAHAALDRVEELLPSARLRTRIRYLLERGRVWNSSGAPERGRPLFAEVWELARQDAAERYYAVDAAHMLAIVGAEAEQIEWNRRGIELALTSADPRVRGWCAALHNNLGWTYFGLGKYAEMLASFQTALEWWRQSGSEREVRIARWCIGRALRALDRYDEALALQQTLLAEWEASGEQQDGYVSEELGECLLALGRVEESRVYFADAYRLLAQDPQPREAERLARLRRLGTTAEPGPQVGS